jgi:high-affinity Fe2+/Pb2+ permease
MEIKRLLSSLEFKIFIILHIAPVILFFKGIVLWEGIFSANNSHSSQLYGSAFSILIIASLFLFYLYYAIILDFIRYIRGKKLTRGSE